MYESQGKACWAIAMAILVQGEGLDGRDKISPEGSGSLITSAPELRRCAVHR